VSGGAAEMDLMIVLGKHDMKPSYSIVLVVYLDPYVSFYYP
jgi:hypothetical protein